MSERILMPYVDVRRKIRDVDLLLFRRRNRISRLIAVAGRSQYVHAAMWMALTSTMRVRLSRLPGGRRF